MTANSNKEKINLSIGYRMNREVDTGKWILRVTMDNDEEEPVRIIKPRTNSIRYKVNRLRNIISNTYKKILSRLSHLVRHMIKR